MKHLVIPMMLSVSLLVTSTGLALALDVHKFGGPATGQPSQAIRTQQTGFAVPGNTTSLASPGSPFGNTAFSATRYSGSGFQIHSSTNPKSVSQYDVAGFQLSNNHGHTH